MPDTFIQQTELTILAREARESAGLTQMEAADRLGIKQANISRAENDSSGRYLSLQLRMIRELAGWTIDGPYWKVEKE